MDMRFLPIITLFFTALCSATENTPQQKEQETAVENRIQEEQKSQQLPFSILAHKPNYLLPFSYNDKIKQNDAYKDGDSMQKLEIEFQISFKMPLAQNIAGSDFSAYFAYTQVSFWQAYNFNNSSPFRETNYEPELFVQWDGNVDLGDSGWKLQAATFGFTHQSNGRAEPLSRSWNRLEGRVALAYGDLVLAFNPWHRFKESSDDDNNPDLLDYYGHGKLTAAYKFDEHVLSMTTRNNFESGFSKGSIEATWSFPIYQKVRGYVKGFSGYGNSLIEYNQYTNTLGFGISMTDWL